MKKKLSFIVMPHSWEVAETIPSSDIFKAIARIPSARLVDYHDFQALFNRNERVRRLYRKITAGSKTADAYFSRLVSLIAPADYYIFYIHWWNYGLAASLTLSGFLKARDPAAKVIFFGPYCKAYHREILRENAWVDGVFIDAMDKAVVPLAKGAGMEEIGNLSYRSAGGIRTNEIQRYSFHRKSCVSYQKYLDVVDRHQLYMAAFFYYDLSQGCKNDCFYCCLKSRDLRVTRADFAARELAVISREVQCPYFYFTDNALNFNNDFLMDFLKKLGRKRVELRWSAYMIPKDVDRKMLESLRAAGCIHIRWGVESADPVRQRQISKRLDLSEVPVILHQAHECGIRNQVSLITGFPHETRNERVLMAEFIAKNRQVLDVVNIYRFKVRRESLVFRNPALFRISLIRSEDRGIDDAIPFDEIGGMTWAIKRRRQEQSRLALNARLSALGIMDLEAKAVFLKMITGEIPWNR